MGNSTGVWIFLTVFGSLYFKSIYNYRIIAWGYFKQNFWLYMDCGANSEARFIIISDKSKKLLLRRWSQLPSSSPLFMWLSAFMKSASSARDWLDFSFLFLINGDLELSFFKSQREIQNIRFIESSTYFFGFRSLHKSLYCLIHLLFLWPFILGSASFVVLLF